jgi:AraC-like DNA-binding protein
MARDLSGLIGISVSHLFRGFKNSVGVSPFRYITVRRIARAQDLIRPRRSRSAVSLSRVASVTRPICAEYFAVSSDKVPVRGVGYMPAAHAVGYAGDPRN